MFKLTPPERTGVWGYTVIHRFAPGAHKNYPKGNSPESSLAIDSAGALYGTAGDGEGPCGCGLVFKLAP